MNIRQYCLILRQRLSMLEDAYSILRECGLWYHTVYNYIIYNRAMYKHTKHTKCSLLYVIFCTIRSPQDPTRFPIMLALDTVVTPKSH